MREIDGLVPQCAQSMFTVPGKTKDLTTPCFGFPHSEASLLVGAMSKHGGRAWGSSVRDFLQAARPLRTAQETRNCILEQVRKPTAQRITRFLPRTMSLLCCPACSVTCSGHRVGAGGAHVNRELVAALRAGSFLITGLKSSLQETEPSTSRGPTAQGKCIYIYCFYQPKSKTKLKQTKTLARLLDPASR